MATVAAIYVRSRDNTYDDDGQKLFFQLTYGGQTEDVP